MYRGWVNRSHVASRRWSIQPHVGCRLFGGFQSRVGWVVFCLCVFFWGGVLPLCSLLPVVFFFSIPNNIFSSFLFEKQNLVPKSAWEVGSKLRASYLFLLRVPMTRKNWCASFIFIFYDKTIGATKSYFFSSFIRFCLVFRLFHGSFTNLIFVPHTPVVDYSETLAHCFPVSLSQNQ